MKKIIVPTDFSAPSARALKYAIDIIDKNLGEVILVHVVDLPLIKGGLLTPSIYVDDSIVKDSMKSAGKAFQRMVGKYKHLGLKIRTLVEFGNPFMATLKAIEENKADLVIMGTKGASGLKEIFIGSNTEKIVRGASVPVISVPQGSKTTSIRKIVFPNSLSEDIEELTLKVKNLQNFYKAELHLVYVNTPAHFKRDHETIARINAYARRYMLKNYKVHIYNDLNESDGTINFAYEINADMIAMGTHGNRGLTHFFSGSIAEDVVNHVQCPIWTFRTK